MNTFFVSLVVGRGGSTLTGAKALYSRQVRVFVID